MKDLHYFIIHCICNCIQCINCFGIVINISVMDRGSTIALMTVLAVTCCFEKGHYI